MKFLSELSESRLFPSSAYLKSYESNNLAELLLIYLCAMRIFHEEESSRAWTKSYLSKTVQWGSFDTWRSNTTDLYVIIYGLQEKAKEEGIVYPLNRQNVFYWLRSMARGANQENVTRRLFARLDFSLRIENMMMRGVRRRTMNWLNIGLHEKQMVVADLVRLLRHREPRSEILPELVVFKKYLDEELEKVATGEIPDEPVKEEVQVEASKERLFDFLEHATTGATSAASVAAVPSALGVGFDPKGHQGIYQKSEKEKKKDKPIILRR